MRKGRGKMGRLQEGKKGHGIMGTKLLTYMKNVLLKALRCPVLS